MKNKRLPILFFLLFLALFLAANLYLDGKIREKTDLTLLNMIRIMADRGEEISEVEIIDSLTREDLDIDLAGYGIHADQPLLDLTLFFQRRVLMILLFSGLVLFALLLYSRKEGRRRDQELADLIDQFESLQAGHYDQDLMSEESELSRLQNLLFKHSIRMREEARLAGEDRIRLKNNLEDISHQIKTPLTAINLLLDNLNDEDLSPALKEEILRDIRSQTDSITALVLLLLKIAVLDAGTETFHAEELRLSDLLDYAEETLKPLMEEGGYSLLRPVGEVSFIGDRRWEREVYINLIKNALDHSLSKEIRVEAEDKGVYLEVRVINRGHAISPNLKKRIFDRFYRSTDRGNNFGIGLNLAKLVIEKDNGKIGVESEDGENRFIIRYFKLRVI